MLSVLFEDAYILVLNKPAGLSTESGRFGHPSLESMVASYLKEKAPWKKQWSAGVVHRLDRHVCGVIVFAKTRMALKALNRQFEKRELKKWYRALVEHTLPETDGELIDGLIKDPVNRVARIVPHAHPNAKLARLRYHHCASHGRFSWVEVELLTGRYHQIRAQLAAAGCPIVGDLTYGSTLSLAGQRILLQSFRLELTHPKTGVRMTFEVPAEDEWSREAEAVSSSD